MRKQTAKQTYPNLFVRNVQFIKSANFVIALNGDITTLVEQRHDGCPRFRGCIKILFVCIGLLPQF